MGVKCSLLGHDYGDTGVERERAERGDEVVRTAKRVERCRNCDHERTVSENTEVTALSAAAGVVRKPDGTILAATDGMNESNDVATESEDSSGERSESDGGVVVEKSESKSDSSDTDADQMDENGAGGIDEIRVDRPAIRPTRVNRAPGEWPSEPDDEPTRVPTAMRDESAGLGSSGSLTVAQTDTNQWPDETDAVAETRTKPPEHQNATGNESRMSGATTRTGKPVFACPSCGFSAVVTDSPLRAGDICPGCQHGYLTRETRKG